MQAYDLFKNAPKAKRLAGTYHPHCCTLRPPLRCRVIPQVMRRDTSWHRLPWRKAVGPACGDGAISAAAVRRPVRSSSRCAAAGAEALCALPKWLNKDALEFLLVELLRRGVLKEDFAHTAYSTNSYVKVCGPAGLRSAATVALRAGPAATAALPCSLPHSPARSPPSLSQSLGSHPPLPAPAFLERKHRPKFYWLSPCVRGGRLGRLGLWVQAVWSEARLADRLDVTFPVTLVGDVALSDASASAAPKSATAKRGATQSEGAGGEPCKKQRGSECETGLRPAPTVHVLSDDDDDFQ